MRARQAAIAGELVERVVAVGERVGDRRAQHRRGARDGVVAERARMTLPPSGMRQVARRAARSAEIADEVQAALGVGEAPFVNERAGVDDAVGERGERALERRRGHLDLHGVGRGERDQARAGGASRRERRRGGRRSSSTASGRGATITGP